MLVTSRNADDNKGEAPLKSPAWKIQLLLSNIC